MEEIRIGLNSSRAIAFAEAAAGDDRS
jgi:hypothetical protein